MWITRATACEYRKHIHLYRVCRPSHCQRRHCAICTVRLSSCLHSPPVLHFSSIAFSIRSPLKWGPPLPFTPFPLFHSSPVLLSPLGPSHYSVKTKSPRSPLFQYYIAYSVKTKSSIPLFLSWHLIAEGTLR